MWGSDAHLESACRKHAIPITPHKQRSCAVWGLWMPVMSLRAGGTLLIVFQKVTFINTNAIFNQECSVLFCKCDPLVMLFLSHDVSDYCILITSAFAEAGIFSCPTSKTREVRVRFEPFAAISLHSLDKRGYRQ